jgi:hypothetical protein
MKNLELRMVSGPALNEFAAALSLLRGCEKMPKEF